MKKLLYLVFIFTISINCFAEVDWFTIVDKIASPEVKNTQEYKWMQKKKKEADEKKKEDDFKKKIDKKFEKSFEKVFKGNIKPSESYDLLKAVEAAAAGDYENAMKEGGNFLIGKYTPVIGTYIKIVQETSKVVEAIVKMHGDQLYKSPAYDRFFDIVYPVVTKGNYIDPYIPSYMIKFDPKLKSNRYLVKLKNKMIKKELEMYYKWRGGENSEERNIVDQLFRAPYASRVRTALGRETKDDKQIFNHFLIYLTHNEREELSYKLERVYIRKQVNKRKREIEKLYSEAILDAIKASMEEESKEDVELELILEIPFESVEMKKNLEIKLESKLFENNIQKKTDEEIEYFVNGNKMATNIYRPEKDGIYEFYSKLGEIESKKKSVTVNKVRKKAYLPNLGMTLQEEEHGLRIISIFDPRKFPPVSEKFVHNVPKKKDLLYMINGKNIKTIEEAKKINTEKDIKYTLVRNNSMMIDYVLKVKAEVKKPDKKEPEKEKTVEKKKPEKEAEVSLSTIVKNNKSIMALILAKDDTTYFEEENMDFRVGKNNRFKNLSLYYFNTGTTFSENIRKEDIKIKLYIKEGKTKGINIYNKGEIEERIGLIFNKSGEIINARSDKNYEYKVSHKGNNVEVRKYYRNKTNEGKIEKEKQGAYKVEFEANRIVKVSYFTYDYSYRQDKETYFLDGIKYFDNNGRIKEYLDTDDGVKESSIYYTYNSSGYLTEISNYSHRWKHYQYNKICEYNENNEIKKQTNYGYFNNRKYIDYEAYFESNGNRTTYYNYNDDFTKQTDIKKIWNDK